MEQAPWWKSRAQMINETGVNSGHTKQAPPRVTRQDVHGAEMATGETCA